MPVCTVYAPFILHLCTQSSYSQFSSSNYSFADYLLTQSWQAADRTVIIRGIDPGNNKQSLLALDCSNEQQTQQLLQMLQPSQRQHQQEQLTSKGAAANGIADESRPVDPQAEGMQQHDSDGQQQVRS